MATLDAKLQQLHTSTQAQIIRELNPLIAGWAAYYNGCVSATILGQYDDVLEQRLLRWASRQHPGKNRDWLLLRYWHLVGKQKRVFSTHDGLQLRRYQQTSVLEPVKPTRRSCRATPPPMKKSRIGEDAPIVNELCIT